MRPSSAIVLQQGIRFGKYSLRARLATGGTGEVWLAESTAATGAPRRVVLKTLLPHLAAEPEMVSLFLAGAAQASQLVHPNIVRVIESGEGDFGCFVAMDYLEGRTLREVLTRMNARRDALPIWAALRIASCVCDALEYAHSLVDPVSAPLGVLHRDLSPENVMITSEGQVIVLDFGVSSISSTSLASSVFVRGKYAYSAPEQLTESMVGTVVDARSDVYSLGVMLYEMLTGRRPHPSNDDLTVLHAVLTESPIVQRPSSLAAWLPARLDSVVLRALARSPAQRYPSVAVLRSALSATGAAGAVPALPRHLAGLIALAFDEHEATRTPQPTRRWSPVPPPPDGSSLQETTATNNSSPKGAESLAATLSQQSKELGAEMSEATPVETGLPDPLHWLPRSVALASSPALHDWDAALASAERERNTGAAVRPPGKALDTVAPSSEQRPRLPHSTRSSGPRIRPLIPRANHEPFTWRDRAPTSETIGFSGAPTERPMAPAAQAMVFMEKGLDLARKGDITGAIVELERALDLVPGHRACCANISLLRKRLQGCS